MNLIEQCLREVTNKMNRAINAKKIISIFLILVFVLTCSVTERADAATDSTRSYIGSVYEACDWVNNNITDLERYSSVPYWYFADRYDGIAIEIINLSRDLVKNCNSDSEKVRAIHDWIVKEIEYDYDIPSQSFVTAYEDRKCVCEGFAELTTLMMRAVGIPCLYVNDLTHAWNMVYYEGEWLFMDTSSDVTGGGGTFKFSLTRDNCAKSNVTINLEGDPVITDIVEDKMQSIKKGKGFFQPIFEMDEYSCNGLELVLSNGDQITAWRDLNGLLKVSGYDKNKLGEQKVTVYSDYIPLSKEVTVYTSKNKLTQCLNSEYDFKKKYDGKTKSVKMKVSSKNRKIVYTYYTDSQLTKKTTSKKGAKKIGGAPSKVGRYYATAEVLPNNTYRGLSTVFVLRISK